MSSGENKFDYYLLFCSERSGSNFAVDFIERQSGLYSLPVSHILRILTINRTKFGDFSDDLTWKEYIDHCQQIFATGVGSFDKEIHIDLDELLKIKQRNIFSIIDNLVHHTGYNGRKVIIKENLAFEFLPALISSGKIKGILYQVRNPLGVVSSMLRSQNHLSDISLVIDKWNREQWAFIRAIGYMRDNLNAISYRYEDLVAEPDQMVKIFRSFFEITDKKCLNTTHQKFSLKNKSSSIDNLRSIDGSIKSNRNDVALKHLPSDQVHLIEKQCAELMQFFGYSSRISECQGNLYPDWLIEQSPKSATQKIKRSSLSEEEKVLRCNRLELLASLVDRPVQQAAIGLLNWESMDSENAKDILKMSPPSKGA